MTLRLNRIEPDGDNCPEGYEYVHGHRENSGKYIRSFCRRIPKKRIKMSLDVKYPGNTTIKLSGGQGIHRVSMSQTNPTESLFEGEQGERMRELLNADWRDTKELQAFEEKHDERKRRKNE